jgi:hypothetical protein
MSTLSKNFNTARFITSIITSARDSVEVGGSTLKSAKAYVNYQLIIRMSDAESATRPCDDVQRCQNVDSLINECHTKAKFIQYCDNIICAHEPIIADHAAFMERVRAAKAVRATYTVEEAHVEALEVNAMFDAHTEALAWDRRYEGTTSAAERMYCTQYPNTSRTVASFPAYDVYDMGAEVLELTRRQSQQIEFALPFESRNYGTMFRMFKLSGCAPYAGERGSDEAASIARATARNEDLYFMFGLGTSITAHKRPKEYKVLLKNGQLIRYDDHLLQVEVIRGEHIKMHIVQCFSPVPA